MDPAALAVAPPATLDGRFAERLRALPAPARAAWLAAADAVAGEVGAARLRALAVYRALEADLDPADAAGAARATWVLRHDGVRDAVTARVAGRLRPLGGEAARLAEVLLAECDADAGRFADAEARLMAQLAVERGRGTPLEGRLCSSLAQVYRAQARDYEGLVLARRAVAVAERTGPDAARALAEFRVVDILKTLQEGPACDAAVARLAAALDRLAPDDGIVLRRRLEVHRALSALRHRDAPAAHAALARLDVLLARPEPDPADPRWFPALRAEVALSFGDLRGARAALDAVAAAGASDPSSSVLVGGEIELQWALASGARDRAAGIAHRMLDDLEARGLAAVGAGYALLYAGFLAAQFAGPLADPAAAARAYDVAGTAIVHRIRQLDDAMRRVPEVADVTPEDRALLAASRARFVAEQRALLDGVAGVLARLGPAAGAPFAALQSPDGFARVCAWCRRVVTAEGTWLPLGHFLPPAGPLRLTHGICPECLAAARPRPPVGIAPP